MAYLGTNSLCGGFHTENASDLPDLISHWDLNADGVDQEGVSNLTLSGTPETALDPIDTGGVSSMGFDGTDDYGTAAHASAHTAVKAVLLTIQPDTAPSSGNRAILNKGTFLDDGELSIEQRPSGGINAYITAGGVVFWQGSGGSSDGIASTLAVDVACQILFQANSDNTGTELWHRAAGGSWSMVGSSLTPFDISANAEDWYAAASGYTQSLGLFDGVMANVKVFDDRLGTTMREAIPAPVTITHEDEAPATGDALAVPSLSEWLKSDETDPSVTKYVSNQDRGNGSGSSAANAQELQDALTAASPGDVLLAVCQTPGTVEFWDYENGISFPNGSAGNVTVLQARQGDGVVISAGEDFAGARTTNNGFWTQSGLSQGDIDKHIWRSTATFAGGDDNMMGWWIEFGHPHQIVRAGSLTNLRSAYSSADSKADGSGGYAGPSVHKHSDNRVYIRFQRPHVSKYSAGGKWSRNVWPDNPEAVNGSGQFVYPISQDPNDYPIYLTAKVNHSDGQSAFRSASSAGGFYKIGSGINSMGYRGTFAASNHDVAMRRGLHWSWFYVITGTASNPAHDYDLQRARFTDGSKLHLARAEWKFGGWLESIRSVWVGSSDQNAVNNVYSKNCTIADYHEISVLNRFNHSFRYRNNTFFHIYDDGIQSRHDLSKVEIGYCYFRGTGVMGLGEGGTDGNDPDPGNWFIHHNIADCREERNSDWRTHPHPHFVCIPHSPDGDSPKKWYNNLVLYGPDCEEEAGVGLGHAPAEPAQNNVTAFAHEVFNNIVIRQSWAGPGNASERYDPEGIVDGGSGGFGYSRIFRDQTDFVNERVSYDADQSNDLWDYNCYYKDVANPVDGLLRKYRAGQTGSDASFATLAAWRASAAFTTSKASGNERGAYPDGFEGNSTDSAPVMASLTDFPTSRFSGYRPSATSVVTVATNASLSGEDWYSSGNLPDWGDDYFDWDDGSITLAPDPFKGPLDPNGSTLPVGVQNP